MAALAPLQASMHVYCGCVYKNVYMSTCNCYCLFPIFFCRIPFTFFLLIMAVNSMFTIYFFWEVIRISGADIFVYFGIMLFSVFFTSGTFQIAILVGQTNRSDTRTKIVFV